MAMQQGVLSNLPLATTRWRTKMYADDATIFINPAKEDHEATVGSAYITFITTNICIKLTKMNSKLSDRVYELTYSTSFGDLS
jgi:predicted NodU family carbamoyl transferase